MYEVSVQLFAKLNEQNYSKATLLPVRKEFYDYFE